MKSATERTSSTKAKVLPTIRDGRDRASPRHADTLVPIAASLMILAGPTLAQTNSTTSPSSNGAAASVPSGAKINAQTQAALRDSLQNSGFKDIEIIAESYVVRAIAPDGSHAMTVVSPNEVQGVVIGGTGTSAGSSQPQGTNPNADTSSPGNSSPSPSGSNTQQ